MGVKVLAGYVTRSGKKREGAACLFDSATMTAFGPVITVGDAATVEELEEFAGDFADYVEQESDQDPRKLEDNVLHTLLAQFYEEQLGDDEDEEPTPSPTKEKVTTKGGAA